MQGQRREPFISGAVIVIAGLVAYHNSLSGPFVLDDAWNIAANPSIRHLWPPGRVLSPPPDLGVGGRPLYNLSFALNYAWGRLGVRGYHAVNLLIHLLTGLTLFGILRRTLPRCQILRGQALRGLTPSLTVEHQSEVARASSPCAGITGWKPVPLYTALAIALIWTVHPLLTESVTYISERSELLMGLFYLLTLHGFIRYADETEIGKRKPETGDLDPERRFRFSLSAFHFPLFSVAACLFGMAAKEVMVTAPVAVLLYDRTFVAGTFRDALRRRWGYYAALAGTWVVLAWLMVGSTGRRVGFGQGVTAWAYAATECGVVVRYLGLALWPHPLVFDYGSEVPGPTWGLVPDVILVLALLGTTAWALFKGGRSRFPLSAFRFSLFGFAGAWFFLTLAPTSSFIPVGAQPMAENRMYLPLAALVAIAVMAIQLLPRRWRTPTVIGLAACLAMLTIRRNTVYASGLSLWTDTVAKCPGSARARANLGAALYRAGRETEAIAQFREAEAIEPGDPLTHLMLGNILAAENRTADAIEQYEAALRIDPGLAPARERLAKLRGEGPAINGRQTQ